MIFKSNLAIEEEVNRRMAERQREKYLMERLDRLEKRICECEEQLYVLRAKLKEAESGVREDRKCRS